MEWVEVRAVLETIGGSCGRWAALLASIAVFTSCVTPGLRERWVRVELPGLEIVSARSAEETLALARDLALFREVVLEVTNIEGRPRIPTRIFLLDRATYLQLGPGRSVGYFDPGIRDDVMGVGEPFPWRGPGEGATEREIIQHEYVHFLTANEQAANYPLWFKEGWADVLSTVHATDDTVVIGAPPSLETFALDRVRPWLRLSEVVTATRYPRRAHLFYAQSWALVHYLQLGSGSRSEFRRRLSDHIGALALGAPTEAAFEDAFEVSLDDLETQLARYVLFDLYPKLEIPRGRFPEAPSLAARTLGAAEIADALGWLALRRGNAGLAARYFDAALEADPERAGPHAGLAFTHAEDGDWEEAIASARHARRLDPVAPDRRLDLARLLATRAIETDAKSDAKTVGEERETDASKWLHEARTLYRDIIRENPDLPEPHLGLGETFLVEGEPIEEARAPLERAYALLPTHPITRVALARLYARIDRADDAVVLLTPIVATMAETPIGAEAQALIEELDANRGGNGDDAERS